GRALQLAGRAYAHRRARVQRDDPALARLAARDAHEGPVEAREQVPVEIPGIVAGAVALEADELETAAGEAGLARALALLARLGQARDEALEAAHEPVLEADARAGEMRARADGHRGILRALY